MAQFMISVWHDQEYELDFESADAKRRVAQVTEFNDALQAEGAWVFGCGLFPISETQVLRSQGGRVLTTDGPYAESKEHIGGFWIIEATSREAAAEWAAIAAKACEGPVELRPVQGP